MPYFLQVCRLNFEIDHGCIQYMAGQTSIVIVFIPNHHSLKVLDLGTKSSCLTVALYIVVDCSIV
jgi:hypothetical protein